MKETIAKSIIDIGKYASMLFDILGKIEVISCSDFGKNHVRLAVTSLAASAAKKGTPGFSRGNTPVTHQKPKIPAERPVPIPHIKIFTILFF